MKNTGFAGLAASVALLGCMAMPAQAQVAGDYVGTIADGNGITVTVGDDGNGGLAVTALSYGLTTTCHPVSATFSTGWGLGEFAEITGGQAVLSSFYPYIDTKASFAFSGNSVVGRIASITPTFAPYAANTVPKQADLCSSPSLSFTATLSTTASRVARPAPGTATVYLPVMK